MKNQKPTMDWHYMNIVRRPRRNRNTHSIREMVAETHLHNSQLIHPLFIQEGLKKTEISSMPDFFRFPRFSTLKRFRRMPKIGYSKFYIIPQIEEKFKDRKASLSYKKNNLYLKMIQSIKTNFPEATIITDVAMDPIALMVTMVLLKMERF